MAERRPTQRSPHSTSELRLQKADEDNAPRSVSSSSIPLQRALDVQCTSLHELEQSCQALDELNVYISSIDLSSPGKGGTNRQSFLDSVRLEGEASYHSQPQAHLKPQGEGSFQETADSASFPGSAHPTHQSRAPLPRGSSVPMAMVASEGCNDWSRCGAPGPGVLNPSNPPPCALPHPHPDPHLRLPPATPTLPDPLPSASSFTLPLTSSSDQGSFSLTSSLPGTYSFQETWSTLPIQSHPQYQEIVRVEKTPQGFSPGRRPSRGREPLVEIERAVIWTVKPSPAKQRPGGAEEGSEGAAMDGELKNGWREDGPRHTSEVEKRMNDSAIRRLKSGLLRSFTGKKGAPPC